MSGYFDTLKRRLAEAAGMVQEYGEESFVEALEGIEERCVRDVTLVTGDREFPHDLREEIIGIIACNQAMVAPGLPPTKGREMSLTLHSSVLVDKLHEAFHRVAEKKLTTRFGLLTDDPSDILKSRNAWEKTKATPAK